MYRENLNISEFNVLANTRVEPGIMVREHWHDAYELLYVHSGVCEQTVGGATRALDAGCITLVAPRDTHATTATGKTGADIYLVQFTQRFIGDARLKSALIPAPPSAHWEAAFDELYAQNARATGCQRYLLGLKAISDMLYLISLMRPDIAAGADEPEILTLTREAMAGGDFSLADVARRLGYSPEYLSRRFHKDASLTFQRFALETRLRRATELLFDEGKSIPETAEALGYADQSSFARAFRARYGLSPSEFGRLRSPLGK